MYDRIAFPIPINGVQLILIPFHRNQFFCFPQAVRFVPIENRDCIIKAPGDIFLAADGSPGDERQGIVNIRVANPVIQNLVRTVFAGIVILVTVSPVRSAHFAVRRNDGDGFNHSVASDIGLHNVGMV